MSIDRLKTRSGRSIKYNNIEIVEKSIFKKNERLVISRIKNILDRNDTERTVDDISFLKDNNLTVKKIEDLRKLQINKTLHNKIAIDDDQTLESKCECLANAIQSSKYLIVYTGAGISTSSSIPDYRGPNGLWTMLKKGIKVDTPDFAVVEPTYTHMILKDLLDKGVIKQIISQNCDGLHLRSGINDRYRLSELHGNCFIEYCKKCNHEYVRLFDVTQNSKFRKHLTGRCCDVCKEELDDTIIHFGEKLKSHFPYNLEEAEKAVKMADTILCIGSSLKVLRHYKWLWPSKSKQNHNLHIINIQWTPKDKYADLKINGYCDYVLNRVVYYLNKNFNIDVKCKKYDKNQDHLLSIAMPLNDKDKTKRTINSTENGGTTSSYVENNASSWYNKSFKKL